MTKGFVARHRAAKEASIAFKEEQAARAPRRVEAEALHARRRAQGAVESARSELLEAEAAAARWREALANLKEVRGIYASPAEISDLRSRIDLCDDVVARRREALASAEGRLTLLTTPTASDARKTTKGMA